MAQQRPVSQAPAAARTTALGNTRTTAGPVPSISPQATGAQKRPRLTATDFPVAARGLAQLVCLSGVLGLAALVGWRRLIGGDRDEEMELEESTGPTPAQTVLREALHVPELALFSVTGIQDESQLIASPGPTPGNAVAELQVSRRAALQVLATAPAVPFAARPTLAAAGPITANAAGFAIPEIGIGTWAWGDPLFWGYDPKNDGELKEAFNYLLDNGVQFFDSAEVYGFGRSEQLLGDFAVASRRDINVATKFAALPWRLKAKDVVDACEASLKRLQKPQIELYQIHFPNAWANEDYWDGLAQCYERGLVKAVGVSNYGKDAVRAVHAALAKRGIPLVSNQIQYSLLYPYANENGLKEVCDELGVKILAYSPLGLGLLTGKYTPTNLPKGPRAALAKTYLEDPAYLRLLDEMRDVAAAHGIPRDDRAGCVQVALNWCRAKGTVPIPGVRSLRQAQQNIACLQWDMTAAEAQRLDAAAEKLPLPAVAPFAKEDVFTHLKMFDS